MLKATGSSQPQERPHPWTTLLRYAHTLRHLKPVQIYSRFRPRPSPAVVRRTASFLAPAGVWQKDIRKVSPQTGRDRFRFLNEERSISTWNDGSIPKLWLYNLHYFAYADQNLIEQWIAQNLVGQGIGWDPYPTSLRVANWCKWALSRGFIEKRICDSLATQAAWIDSSVEHHLLANHLLANAKALLFAGTVLESADSHDWFVHGQHLLRHELPRQILKDGGHVERSPMYHSIILEDLLDLSNLANAYGITIPEIANHIPRVLAWLQSMTHPDGEISLFNDASFCIAPPPAALLSYARTLGYTATDLTLGESGYIRLENGSSVLIFDTAPLGPDYQPGHGHADTLSFELSHRGKRLLVNSGTSTYEMNSIRDYERGTAAHNTLRIDDLDQSEMWAAFRVARRAHPFAVLTDHKTFAEAAHDGYHRLRHAITHRRRLDLDENYLTITDRLEGTGQHKAEIFFHIAPGADPAIALDPKLEVSHESATYATGWNLRVPNRVIVGRWNGPCPVEFTTRIALNA